MRAIWKLWLKQAILCPKTLDQNRPKWYGLSRSKREKNTSVNSVRACQGAYGRNGTPGVRHCGERPPIKPTTKHLAAKLAIAIFRTARAVKRGAERLLVSLGYVLAPIGRLFVRFFILPIYRIVVILKLRVQRLALPARGFLLFFVTNRYVFHATIGVVTAVTIVANVQGRQVHAQDVGHKSLLFAIATEQKTEIVEEIVRPETAIKNANYLGSATLVGIPHIDFDYDETVSDVPLSIIVPGTIAAQPIEEEPGGPRPPRTRTESYLVKDGDTISTIAHAFGVNIGTILWNNNLSERQYIRPGDTLRIPPVSGMLIAVKKGDTLSKLAQRYAAEAGEIATFNGLSLDQQLAIGTELVVPGGHPPEIAGAQIAQYGFPPSRNPLTLPSPSPKPPNAPSALPKDKFLWPTTGRVITQYYGWRHTGVDIDGDYSSPIYAAADGVVEKAGWNSGGYGLMILISHPNGMRTRYAHASKLFVKVGDAVKRGEVIAMVGTTGRSTGTHVHFELYTGSARVNPLGYIR